MRTDQGLWPRWTLRTEGTILPDERLPAGPMLVLGLQHVVAMFGATALAPILMGFDPNVSILFSGFATLIFFVIVGGRVPSYLGSSFAFIGPVLAATGSTIGTPNPNIGVALGGIIAAGALYTLIGLVVALAGHRWVERLMPPVVTGAIVAASGSCSPRSPSTAPPASPRPTRPETIFRAGSPSLRSWRSAWSRSMRQGSAGVCRS